MAYGKRNASGAMAPRASAAPRAAAPAPSSSGGAEKKKSIWTMQFGKSAERTYMKRIEVLLFTSELADLIEAGMTLGQALQALAGQGEEGSGQRYVCQDLCDRIVRGESFSDACSHHPKTFQPLYANMLRAAEASGAMVEVLRRLGDHYERSDNMRSKIKGALTYPIVVLCFGVFAVIGALVWIIPRFQKVFTALGASLPLPTRMLIAMSDFVIQYGWLMLCGAAAFFLWFRKWRQTPEGRMKIDGLKLRLPLVSGIIANGAYATLAYTLKTLLSNGVNVLQALKISEETCENSVIGGALAEARKRVTDGTSISGPLAASGVFPRLMTDMLAVGERAGDMTGALGHIGRRYEKDMERHIAAFTSALEPILIVLIAVVIGFVAIAILMAVFQMAGSLS